MIYLFNGNSSYLIQKKVSSWKKAFLEKFGDLNLLHIKELSYISDDFLRENLLSNPFLGDKKLIIIEDFFKKPKTKKDDENKIDDENNSFLEDFFISILPRVPENNIVVLTSDSIPKTSKIYKWIKENGKIEEFDIKDDVDLKANLKKIYPDFTDSKALDLLIKYKSGDIYKITNEIEKLLILNKNIDENIIKKFVTPEIEQSIFSIVDDFLNLKGKDFFVKLQNIFQNISYHVFFPSFLSIIRTNLYIEKLKSHSYSNHRIISDLDLGNRGFLVDKTYKVSFEKLIDVYEDLVNLDSKMKSGDFIGSNEEDFKFELDKVFLNYFMN